MDGASPEDAGQPGAHDGAAPPSEPAGEGPVPPAASGDAEEMTEVPEAVVTDSPEGVVLEVPEGAVVAVVVAEPGVEADVPDAAQLAPADSGDAAASDALQVRGAIRACSHMRHCFLPCTSTPTWHCSRIASKEAELEAELSSLLLF